MRKNLSLVFSLLALIAVFTLLLDYKITPRVRTLDDISQDSYQPAHQAPDFSFTEFENRQKSLSDFKGKIVILHFWATWCPPCISEFPKLVSVSKKLQDNIVLLAVSSDGKPDVIERFIDKSVPDFRSQPNMYMVWDQNRTITHDLYQTFAYPETIIIDGSGQMIRKIPGDADWTSPEMESYLQSVIGSLADNPVKP